MGIGSRGLGMSLRALRSSLVASASVLAGTVLSGAVQAQQSVTLGEISVVSTSPVGSGGGTSSQAQTFNGPGPVPPLGSVPPTGLTRLRGSEQPLYKIPSTVETGHRERPRRSIGPTTIVVATLARRTPGLNISDSQGN